MHTVRAMHTNDNHRPPELLTTAQAAARIGVSVRTIHRLRERGLLRAQRLAGSSHLRFRAADVDAMLTPADGEALV